MVADRGMDIEAQVLEVIQELREERITLSVKEMTNRFAERHAEDFERKITPHWIGQIVRRKLGLKTEKRHGSYVVAASEGPKLARLFEKYGIGTSPGDLGDSGDSTGEAEGDTPTQEPLNI